MQQLDLGIWQVDEDHRDTVIGFILRRADTGAQRIAILGDGGGQVRHRNGDMVQTSYHGVPPRDFDPVMTRAEPTRKPRQPDRGGFTLC